MSFDNMSFGDAVSYVRTVWALIDILILTLPITAAVSIMRGKRNRPGAKLFFPRFVLWGWLTLFLLAVAYYFTGLWYGENGPSPQTAAAQSTITLIVVLIAVGVINAALFTTTRRVPSSVEI